MHYNKDTFTSRDGLNLTTHIWKNQENPSYVISLIHGLGEHAKRYDELAAFFVKKGCVVMAFDLRGHGLSAGKKGHTPKYKNMIDDVEDFIALSGAKYPDVKQILYGHSLGGNLLLNFLLSRKTKAYAAVASSPFLRTAFTPPAFKVAVGKVLRSLWPSLQMHNGLNLKDLSSAKPTQEHYSEDSLIHSKISVELALSSIEQGLWALDRASEIALPLLCIHGTADNVTDHTASIDFMEKVDAKFGCLKLYEGLFHELHHETQAEEISSDVFRWIKEVSH